MALMAACYSLKRLASFLECRGAYFKSKPSKTEMRLQAANHWAIQALKGLY